MGVRKNGSKQQTGPSWSLKVICIAAIQIDLLGHIPMTSSDLEGPFYRLKSF